MKRENDGNVDVDDDEKDDIVDVDDNHLGPRVPGGLCFSSHRSLHLLRKPHVLENCILLFFIQQFLAYNLP